MQSLDPNLSVCFHSQSARNPKREGRGRGREQKTRGSYRPKMFAESILNTVLEVTIYLMPAKLARTSGAGYLVQLFMISSKI